MEPSRQSSVNNLGQSDIAFEYVIFYDEIKLFSTIFQPVTLMQEAAHIMVCYNH